MPNRFVCFDKQNFRLCVCVFFSELDFLLQDGKSNDDEDDVVLIDGGVDDWRKRRKGKTPLIGRVQSEADIKPDVNELQQQANSVQDRPSSADSLPQRLPPAITQPTMMMAAAQRSKSKTAAKSHCEGSSSAQRQVNAATAGGDSNSNEELRQEVKQLKETLKSLRADALKIMQILVPDLGVITDLEHVDGVLAEMVRVNKSSNSAAASEMASGEPQARSRCYSRASSDDVEITHVEQGRGQPIKTEEVKEERMTSMQHRAPSKFRQLLKAMSRTMVPHHHCAQICIYHN